MKNTSDKIILYLAPLRGFTEYIYRNAFSRHFSGFDIAMAPFISTMSDARLKDKHLKDVLPENNQAMPVIPQILGNNADDFILLANRLFDLGYETVNWNLGCPFPMVAKKQRGSGLLPYPQKIEAFLEATIAAIPNRLSIKARLGREKTDEILTLLEIFNRYPLEEVIIHPRTGKQMYDGVPDLDMFEKCLEISVHTTVYNGDINDLETFEIFSNRFKTISKSQKEHTDMTSHSLPSSGLHICPWWVAYTFDNPLRKIFHKPGKILGDYVKEGMTVMDLGCGMGHFSIGMARLVGHTGKVIAVDLQQKMLDVMGKRAQRAGMADRISTHLCRADELEIGDQVDFVLAFWMVHEVPDQKNLFSSLKSILGADGKMLIAEPKMHVTVEDLKRTTDIAQSCGWHCIESPGISFSQTALLGHGPEYIADHSRGGVHPH